MRAKMGEGTTELQSLTAPSVSVVRPSFRGLVMDERKPVFKKWFTENRAGFI